MVPCSLPTTDTDLSKFPGSPRAVPELQRLPKVQQPISQSLPINSSIHYGYQNHQQSIKLSQLKTSQQPINLALQDNHHQSLPLSQLQSPQQPISIALQDNRNQSVQLCQMQSPQQPMSIAWQDNRQQSMSLSQLQSPKQPISMALLDNHQQAMNLLQLESPQQQMSMALPDNHQQSMQLSQLQSPQQPMPLSQLQSLQQPMSMAMKDNHQQPMQLSQLHSPQQPISTALLENHQQPMQLSQLQLPQHPMSPPLADSNQMPMPLCQLQSPQQPMSTPLQENHHQSMLLSQLQSPQQPISMELANSWQRRQVYSPTIPQSRLQPGTPNNVLEKLKPSALHQGPCNQRAVEVQNNSFGLLHQQRSSFDTDSHKMQRHQKLEVHGRPEFSTSHQNFPQPSQQMQFNEWCNTGSLSDILPQGMQKKIQAMTSHPHSMIADPTARRELPNKAQWHDQAYKQLQSMKELYLPELTQMHRTTQELCIQPPNAETAIKYEKTRIFLERSMRFLQMERGDIVHCSKEKMYGQMDFITRYIYQARRSNPVSGPHRQPLPEPLGSPSKTTALVQKGNTLFQFGSSPLTARQGAVNLQSSPIYSSQGSSLSAMRNPGASDIDPFRGNLVRFTQQNAVRAPQQSNMSIWLNHSSQTRLERAHDSLSAPQRALDSIAARSVPPNSTAVKSQNVIRWEEHQTMQAQKMKQPLHQPQIDHDKKRMMVLRGEKRYGRAVDFGPRPNQQHHQQTGHTSQTLVSPSSYKYHTASPQNSQSGVYISSRKFIAATPSQSAGSPYTVPSPLTPLTPSSIQVDHEKNPSGFSPITTVENVRHSMAPASTSQHKSQALDCNNVLARDTVGTVNSHLLSESAEQEHSQQISRDGPITRLIEAVKLSSPQALTASVRDIEAVTTDNGAGTLHYRELTDAIGEDLPDDLNHWERDNLIMEHGNTSEKRIKRNFDSRPLEDLPTPSCEIDSFKKLNEQKSESESTSISQFKRQKTKTSDFLVGEINEVNKHLVETVVDVVQDGTDFSRYGFDEGTIVMCSYVALGEFAESNIEFPNLLLRLLVTSDYPHSSPRVLDASTRGSCEKEEAKCLLQKTMSKFRLLVRTFPDPIPLTDMAKAWEVCAREVFRDYAKLFGGDSFSSRHGPWKNCVVTA